MKNFFLTLLCILTGGFWLAVMLGEALEEHHAD